MAGEYATAGTDSRMGHATSAPTPNQLSVERWSIPKRVAFRFAVIWLFLNLLVVYSPESIFPVLGSKVGSAISSLFGGAAMWVGTHWIHLTGSAAQVHPTNSRDEALDWITAGILLVLSMVGTVAWSLLDSRRPNYKNASLWSRYLLRLCLVFLMFRYGIGKVFPLQMNPPSLAVLNEPVGQSSPMTLFWTLMAVRPGYEIFTGAIEIAVALLLLFRRTAVLGAVLNLFVMSTVLVDNLVFDIPVKLGATLILLTTLFVVLPDLDNLYRFFLKHQPTRLIDDRVPWQTRRRPSLMLHAAEAAFAALCLYTFVPGAHSALRAQHEAARHPSGLVGGWRIERATLTGDGTSRVAVAEAEQGNPVTEIFFDPDGLGMARSADGRLWRMQVAVDGMKHEAELVSYFSPSPTFGGAYAFELADGNHLTLMPTGADSSARPTLHLSRVPTAARYPLLERGLHWSNEWAYER